MWTQRQSRTTLRRLSLSLPLCASVLTLGCGVPQQDAAPRHNSGGEYARHGFEEAVVGEAGTPTFLAGRMIVRGETPAATDEALAQAALLGDLRASYRLSPGTAFAVRNHSDGEHGSTYIRLQQLYRGLPVLGREVAVQVGKDRTIETILGQLAPDLDLSIVPSLPGEAALTQGLARLTSGPSVVHTRPALAVFVASGVPRLVYRAIVEYRSSHGRAIESIVVDAHTGEVLHQVNRIQTALNRDIYTLKGVCVKDGSELPGMLVFREGGSSMDMSATKAYENSGAVYWFYKHSFGRDGYDSMGATLTSSVLAQFDGGGFCDGGNAAWVGDPFNQMIYGEGSFFGFLLKDLTLGFDVAAHELIHAVTDKTSSLEYKDESGALNEALSDILGATAEAWQAAGGGASGSPRTYEPTANTWKIGEDVVGPLFPGGLGALRLMNNPTADMTSKDYYPERFVGMEDNGGVHLNSGIANLAFYLLSVGGKHPRGKTTVDVPKLGLDKAMRIFYYANVNLLTSTSQFQDARFATARVAESIHGRCSPEWEAIHRAWDAVGVPGLWDLCVSPPGGF